MTSRRPASGAIVAAWPTPISKIPGWPAAYDALEGPRRDLDAYVALAEELGARSVLDIGCGTGTLAYGWSRVGSQSPASTQRRRRSKSHGGSRNGNAVRWCVGRTSDVPALEVDLVTMTGNVAQVFITDEDGALRCRWRAALSARRACWCSRRATRVECQGAVVAGPDCVGGNG